MDKIRILWVDDEIEMLKPHIIFLEQKGYDVDTSNNGDDALELIMKGLYDIIFLDENMPGLTGIETLEKIKAVYPNLPVVMITKSEEESIMEDAIGSNISDYLIKPVKPNQILLSLKKNLENKKLVSEKTTFSYQQEFRQISMDISANPDYIEWGGIYRRLTRWELELEKSSDESMSEVLQMQKDEANQVFSRFVEDNYLDWIHGRTKDRPVMSPNLFKDKIFPLFDSNDTLFVLLVDNLRYDQWKAIQPMIEEFYRVEREELYYSILPTTTQYARNAIFSGLMPLEIQRKYPKYWVAEEEDFEKEIANCRTFVFLHELEYLLANKLIKGGDLSNAIVFVNRPVSQEEFDRLAKLFNKPSVKVGKEGVLNHLEMHFENEPARHKMLDVVGDISLLGKPIKAHVIARRPGHGANAALTRLIKEQLLKESKMSHQPKYDPNLPPVMDIAQIKKVLPHRPPFLLIDKIIEMEETRIVGVKNVTMNEHFFVGHFPDEPVMPGVLQVEAMAQVGGVLALSTVVNPNDYTTLFLKIDKVKFRQKVVPGDTLIFDVSLLEPIRRGICHMKGMAWVGNKVVAEVELMASIVPKGQNKNAK